MKKLLTLIVLAAFIFSGCSKDEPVNSSNDGTISFMKDLKGEIVNLKDRNDLNILFDVEYNLKVYASSNIDSAGKFSLNWLPVPPEDLITEQIYPSFAPEVKFLENTLVCSNKSEKLCTSTLRVSKDSITTFGYVRRQNYESGSRMADEMPHSGDFFTAYVYVNRDVTLNGKLKYFYPGSNHEFESHVTLTYNVTYRKGWNKFVSHTVKWNMQKQGNYEVYDVEIEYLDKEPGPAYFYFFPFESVTNRTVPLGISNSGYKGRESRQ